MERAELPDESKRIESPLGSNSMFKAPFNVNTVTKLRDNKGEEDERLPSMTSATRASAGVRAVAYLTDLDLLGGRQNRLFIGFITGFRQHPHWL